MKNILTISIILFSHITVLKGQVKINALVVDKNEHPIEGALAIRLTIENRSIIESAFSDSMGVFSFENIDFANEFISISCTGYTSQEITTALEKDIIKITLEPLSVTLDEIMVVNKANVIQKSDRLIFNVTNKNLVKGNNTYDLLKFTPLIQIENNVISISGNQPAILYIDGRKSNLPEGDILSYLKSLPANLITSIEVVTNPGAAYKLTDNQGIINLILKKRETDGVKGTLSISSYQNNRNSQYAGLYMDYQKNKLNLTINIYPSYNDFSSKDRTEYSYFNTKRHDYIKSKSDLKYLYLGGNIRADYHLTKNQVLGVILNGSYTKGDEKEFANTAFSHLETNVIDSIYISYNKTKRPTKRFNINANYRMKVSSKGNLSLDFDYLTDNSDYSVLNDFYRQENPSCKNTKLNLSKSLRT